MVKSLSKFLDPNRVPDDHENLIVRCQSYLTGSHAFKNVRENSSTTSGDQGGIWGRSQWGGGKKGRWSPHPSISPLPPHPLSIPPKFSDKPVGGKVRSSEGEVPRLPPLQIPPCWRYPPLEDNATTAITPAMAEATRSGYLPQTEDRACQHTWSTMM